MNRILDTRLEPKQPNTPPPADEPVVALGAPGDLPRWIDTLQDGSQVLVRALQKDDVELERSFIRRLGPESRRLRFLGQIREPSEELLRKLVDLDYKRDLAFIALVDRDGEKRAVGVSRYSLTPDGVSCECAVTVADDWQNRGLGTALMRHLITIARQRGIRSMVSVDAAENWRMRELAGDLGFSREPDPIDSTQVIHRLDL
jgi:GNAT superfamily N-acetyltransferase